MNVALISAVVLVVLFVLTFLTKRRFGVLGLALAAGAMLSSLWAETLTPIIEEAGVELSAPPLLTVVSVSLGLLPAVLLLFSGPSYKTLIPRLGGAFCFSILALALLIEPIGQSLMLSEQGEQLYDFFVSNRVYIVTIGLVAALFDLLTTRSGGRVKASKH